MQAVRRKCVILFAIMITLIPQGIRWVQEGKGMPLIRQSYQIFGLGETKSGLHMLHLNLLVYLHLIALLMVTFGYVYRSFQKKEWFLMACSMRFLVKVSLVRMVLTLFWADKLIPEVNSWTWFFEIAVIQFVIAKSLEYLYSGKRRVRTYVGAVLENFLYTWLLMVSVHAVCFQQFLFDCDGSFAKWIIENYLFTLAYQTEEPSLMSYGVPALAVALVAGILLIIGKKHGAGVIVTYEKLLDIVSMLFLMGLGVLCLLLEELKTETWYFTPRLINTVLISWSCWRLAGAASNGVS